MNFEYDSLMHKLGLDMYNQYSKQMKSLQDRDKQAVRVNIKLDKIQTETFIQEKDCYKATINMAISEDKYMKGIEEELRLTSARVRYESCYSITLIKRHKKKIVRRYAVVIIDDIKRQIYAHAEVQNQYIYTIERNLIVFKPFVKRYLKFILKIY